MEINIFDLEEAKKMVMASLNVVITGVSWGLGRALKVEGMRGVVNDSLSHIAHYVASEPMFPILFMSIYFFISVPLFN